MSKRNSAFRSFLACVVLLAFSGGRWPKAQSEPPSSTPRPHSKFEPLAGDDDPTDLAPDVVLAKAIAELSPERVSWLEVQLWQRMIDHAGAFVGVGRLLRGPYHTVNLRLQIERDNRTSVVKCVSDGRRFAKTIRIENGKPNTVRSQLPDESFSSDLNLVMAHRESFLQSNGCAGPVGLLRTIQQKVHHLRLQEGTWDGKRTIRIEGEFKAVMQDKSSGTTDSFSPPYSPRKCRLFLDTKTLWPYRIEWWDDRSDVLVLEMEFRDPIINQPAPQHRWAAEFAVPDGTEEHVEAR